MGIDFGEVRELMNMEIEHAMCVGDVGDFWDDRLIEHTVEHVTWCERLKDVLQAMSKDEALHEVQTYMSGFPNHFAHKLWDVHSLVELERAVELVPCARFGLDLSRDDLCGATLVDKLVNHEHIERVVALNLSSKSISTKGLITLGDSGCLSGLHELNLSYNNITLDGWVHVFKQSDLSSLRSLSLNGSRLGDDGVEALCTALNPNILVELSLDSNSIGLRGVKALCQVPNWPQLRILTLDFNKVTAQGAHALGDCKQFKHLYWIGVEMENIGNLDGMEALAYSSYLADSIRNYWSHECYRYRNGDYDELN